MFDLLNELNLTQEQFDNFKYYDKIKCNCFKCNKSFERNKKLLLRHSKTNTSTHIYCSKICNFSQRCRKGKIIKCKTCGKEHYKPPFQIKKKPNYFCSRSCSSIYRWRNHIKNELKCKCCNKILTNKNRYLFCNSCFILNRRDKIINMTLKEFQNEESVKGKHPSWINTNVRNLCRSLNSNLANNSCQSCGYSKHIEFAHIKAISRFDLDTPIKVVNSSNNILILCPNCHWEFDNGLLKLENIKPRT